MSIMTPPSESLVIDIETRGTRRGVQLFLGASGVVFVLGALLMVLLIVGTTGRPLGPIVLLGGVFLAGAATSLMSFRSARAQGAVLEGTLLRVRAGWRTRQADLAKVDDAAIVSSGSDVPGPVLTLRGGGSLTSLALTNGALSRKLLPAAQLHALGTALATNPGAGPQAAAALLQRGLGDTPDDAPDPASRTDRTSEASSRAGRRWLAGTITGLAGAMMLTASLLTITGRWHRVDTYFQADGEALSYATPHCPSADPGGSVCTVTAQVQVTPPGPAETVPVTFDLAAADRLAHLPPQTVQVWVSTHYPRQAYSAAPRPASPLGMATIAGLAAVGFILVLQGLSSTLYAWRDRRLVAPPPRRAIVRFTVTATAAAIAMGGLVGWHEYYSTPANHPASLTAATP